MKISFVVFRSLRIGMTESTLMILMTLNLWYADFTVFFLVIFYVKACEINNMYIVMQGYDSIPREIRDPKAKEVRKKISFFFLGTMKCMSLIQNSHFLSLISLKIGMKKRMVCGNRQRYQILHIKDHGNAR